MRRLTFTVRPGTTVGIDTMTFIYHIEAVPPYLDVVRPLFERLAAGDFAAVTSVISLAEIAVGPLQQHRPEVADDYELLIRNYPHLTVLDVDRWIARRAAELRAQERLRLADSLQVATALEGGATTFLTNDRRLSRLAAIQVLILDEFLPSA